MTVASVAIVPHRAKTGHASVRVLAARVLAIGSKQKSAALRAGSSNVAPAATRSALLLRGAAGPERKRGVGLISRRGGPWFVNPEARQASAEASASPAR